MPWIIVGGLVAGGLYSLYLWFLFDWCLRPEVRNRARRRKEQAYRERMANPEYRKRFDS